MPLHQMQIYKYLPDRMYGFAVFPGSERQVFFHLGSFDPGREWSPHPHCESCPRLGCDWSQVPPPPIIGEKVDVLVDLESQPEEGAPRATRVQRIVTPKPLIGKVKSFDAQRGYGFIEDSNSGFHYLHKSDIIGRHIPIIGQVVMFYAGEKRGKSRACHVRICPS